MEAFHKARAQIEGHNAPRHGSQQLLAYRALQPQLKNIAQVEDHCAALMMVHY